MPDIHANAAGVLIHGVHGTESFSLNVAEACSGMRLLLAFLALGVAMAYLEYRPIIHRIILLASTIPIAIFCNILRVLITGFIHIYIGPEYASGLLHTLLGIVMLGVAFALYGLLAWIMNNLVVEEDTGQILVVGQNVENQAPKNESGN
jgi:exosortase